MSDWVSLSDRERRGCQRRREALLESLAGRPALISAGAPRIRNFPANHCGSFRATSSFLYLIGRSIPQAELLFDGQSVTLFCEGPDPDDALWHGPRPSLSEVSKMLGCATKPLTALPAALDGLTPLTLPAFESGLRESLSALLGYLPTVAACEPPSLLHPNTRGAYHATNACSSQHMR